MRGSTNACSAMGYESVASSAMAIVIRGSMMKYFCLIFLRESMPKPASREMPISDGIMSLETFERGSQPTWSKRGLRYGPDADINNAVMIPVKSIVTVWRRLWNMDRTASSNTVVPIKAPYSCHPLPCSENTCAL